MADLRAFVFLLPFVIGFSLPNGDAIAALEAGAIPAPVPEPVGKSASFCDPTKCAGVCTNAGCKLYPLIGDQCGGPTNVQCEPCDVCKPNVLGLPYTNGKCAAKIRCNNQWCDDGFCFITQNSTGNVSYLVGQSAPPVSPDFTQRCVKWAGFEDRCIGGNTTPPLDYQYCAPPLQCYKGRGPSPGICRLPTCSNDLCAYKGQQFLDGFCGINSTTNALQCTPYRQEGESCGGLGPQDIPYCEPSSLLCVLEAKKYVCRVSSCLTTCTGEYCLPSSDGTNAVCGGEGAPPLPTTTTPTPVPPTQPIVITPTPTSIAVPPPPSSYYYGSPKSSFLELAGQQAPSPLCCSAKPLPPKPPVPAPAPLTFMELAAMTGQSAGCCPVLAGCPVTVAVKCTSNPATTCNSCATCGLYNYPPPPAPY